MYKSNSFINLEEEVLLLMALAEDEERERCSKRRKIWIHNINSTRTKDGEFYTLYPILRSHEERFYIYFRMTFGCFDEILQLIEEDIQKNKTNYREPIPPVERLAIALRFLVTGDSFKTIGHSFRVGFSTISKIVKEVCEAIWKRLQPIYMPEPTTEIWEQAILGFNEKWRFPNCLGSIDGKHVTIKCPNNSGSNYFCYLKKFSIVLMAIAGPDYKFICVDVGAYGKNSDGGIFEASVMGQRFKNNTFNTPTERPLPNQEQPTPCVLIGDEAFALSAFLMRPFPYRKSHQDEQKETYNKRLCQARRVVENACILAQKWRVFHRPIEVKVETAIGIVKTTCVLHNYLLEKKSQQQYVHLLDNAEPGANVFDNLRPNNRRAVNFAFNLRERFVQYFNQE